MNHYHYHDYKTGKPVFECDAESITKADELLLQATNVSAEKASHIGCTISENPSK